MSTLHRTLAEAIESFARGVRRCNRPEDRALASDYLAALAPVLASAVLGQDILRELRQIDRLFGQTWLMDDAPFRDALQKWATFKHEYERFALSGMTVNERLAALDLEDTFERAFESGDEAELKRLLKSAHVDDLSIQEIIRMSTSRGSG